ncbi:uncharacterized protein BJ171DRAFT_128994 [Polychytrium aggregatum]|uniref:uncharacterized protein n=1 Tax=Polychytrium aggregatum TaxID=110093 RepID=UPI0022FF1AC0|nr:uncharacterized protein BJ171DRAFT_128994 [Polychytrium aggregatum]KAI9204118.1 hypothetical protein BJ171DRAFT_128994 [Polychytrium aggregatum]
MSPWYLPRDAAIPYLYSAYTRTRFLLPFTNRAFAIVCAIPLPFVPIYIRRLAHGPFLLAFPLVSKTLSLPCFSQSTTPCLTASSLSPRLINPPSYRIHDALSLPLSCFLLLCFLLLCSPLYPPYRSCTYPCVHPHNCNRNCSCNSHHHSPSISLNEDGKKAKTKRRKAVWNVNSTFFLFFLELGTVAPIITRALPSPTHYWHSSHLSPHPNVYLQ